MSEPVLRAQFPAAIPGQEHTARPAPAGTFTNHGGVERFQINSPVESIPDAQHQAVRPSTGGVLRSTTRTNPLDGSRITETDIGQSISRNSDADGIMEGSTNNEPLAPPQFRSPSGRTLMAQEITKSSVVVLGNGVTTSVAAALAAGFIVQNDHGMYVNANDGTARGPMTPAQELEARQRQQEQDEADKNASPVPQVEPLDDESEAILTEAVARVGNLDANSAVHSIIDTGALTPDIIGRFATSLNTSPEEVSSKVSTVMAGFEKQARAVMGAGSDAIIEYAHASQPKMLREAMMEQANLGTTSGYKALAQSYMEHLADTPAGRETIKNATNAQAYGVTEDARSGKLFVTLDRVGKVEWRVAVRQGLIPMPKRNW